MPRSLDLLLLGLPQRICTRICCSCALGVTHPLIPLSKTLFSHLLDSFVPFVHSQTWVYCPGLIARFCLVSFDFFDWVFGEFLHHKCAFLFQFWHIFLKKFFVFLILVQKWHGGLEILSCFLVSVNHHFIEQFLVLLRQSLSIRQRVIVSSLKLGFSIRSCDKSVPTIVLCGIGSLSAAVWFPHRRWFSRLRFGHRLLLCVKFLMSWEWFTFFDFTRFILNHQAVLYDVPYLSLDVRFFIPLSHCWAFPSEVFHVESTQKPMATVFTNLSWSLLRWLSLSS